MAKGIRRRQAMLALGARGTGSVLSASRVLSGAFDGLLSPSDAEAASCVLTPEQTEGPCYIDEELSSRGTRDTDNASDGIYRNAGLFSLLTLTPRTSGWQGRLTMGVQQP